MDYSEYLGKNYSENEKFGTVVCNHSSFIDSTILGHLYESKMVSKAAFRDVPIIGRGAELLETIFVDRSDPNSKHNTIEEITKTQKEFIEGKSTKRLGIFPEGTTTNGSCLLAFKPGAFISLTPVKPIVLQISSKYMAPTWDCTGFTELFILLCC